MSHGPLTIIITGTWGIGKSAAVQRLMLEEPFVFSEIKSEVVDYDDIPAVKAMYNNPKLMFCGPMVNTALFRTGVQTKMRWIGVRSDEWSRDRCHIRLLELPQSVVPDFEDISSDGGVFSSPSNRRLAKKTVIVEIVASKPCFKKRGLAGLYSGTRCKDSRTRVIFSGNEEQDYQRFKRVILGLVRSHPF